MYNAQETERQRAERIEHDLDDLRILAYLVKRNRYAREPRRVEGGRRGRARIVSYIFYAEPPDIAEAQRAVRARQQQRGGEAGQAPR